jgi:CRP-like cAMP-binding protein
MDALFKQLEALGAYGENDRTAFKAFLHHATFEKGAMLLKPGQTEQYLYFLEKGMLRFFVEQEEKEITFDFTLPGNFTSAYSSFLTRTPASFYIQALEKISIYRISYDDLQKVYKDSANSQQIGRMAAEQLFIRKAKRELSLLTETAEQRYLNLLEQDAELVQQIPLKYLASYIGITPQALSRIRKRIS